MQLVRLGMGAAVIRSWYTLRGSRTGAWLVELGHDPVLFAPEDWRLPGNRRPLGEGEWATRNGVFRRVGRGHLLVQSPMWLTDFDARTRVWAAERRAARDERRARARARHLYRKTKENR